MTTNHQDITDPFIHEPKGASTASANEVFVADGAGSGDWEKITGDSFDNTSVDSYLQNAFDTGDVDLNGQWYSLTSLADVSAPSSILVPVLKDCTIVRARCTLSTGITVANATVTFKNSAGSSMGTVVITQSGSTEGSSFTFTPSGNNVLTGPTYFKIETDGGSSTTAVLYILVEFEGVVNE